MKKYSKTTLLLPWFICSLGALFYAYEYLLRIAPSVMTDDLTRYFHIQSAQLGNLSAFYYYIYTPMQLVVGVFIDRYGPRRLLTFATLCCVIGSYLFAATSYFWVAAVARLLIGFGSAFAFVGVLKLATIWLPRSYFAMFAGLASALGTLGGIAGDLIMTRLVQHFGWQHTIHLSAVFGIGIALLIGLFVRDYSMDRRKSISAQTETLAGATKGLWKVICNPQMWTIGLIGCLLYLPISAFAELWGIPYMKQALSLSPNQAAFAVTMVFWGWVCGGPIVGWLSDAIKRRCTPLATMPILSALFISIVLYMPHLTFVEICCLLFAFGFFTSAQVLVFAVGRELNSIHVTATACAFVNMIVMLSGLVFQPLIGKILDHFWSGQYINGIQSLSNANYQAALTLIPVFLIIAALFSVFALKETHCVQKGIVEEDVDRDATPIGAMKVAPSFEK